MAVLASPRGDYAAKAGGLGFPSRGSLRELSFADAPLHSLPWPLIHGPLKAVRQHAYAGGQGKRSVALPAGRNSRASRGRS